MQPIDALLKPNTVKAFVKNYCKRFPPSSSDKSNMNLMCYTALVYMLKNCSPKYEEIKIRSIEDLRHLYPSLANDIIDSEELRLFLEFVNSLRMAFQIIPKSNNKDLVLNISSRLEGLSPKKFITGGGEMSLEKKRRIDVYYLEGGEKPIPKKPKQKAREEDYLNSNINNNYEEGSSELMNRPIHEHNHEVRNGEQATLLRQNAPAGDGFLQSNLIHSSFASHIDGQRYNPSMAQATMSNNTDNGLSRKKARGNDIQVELITSSSASYYKIEPLGVFLNNIINNTIPRTDFQLDIFSFDGQNVNNSMSQATIVNPYSENAEVLLLKEFEVVGDQSNDSKVR
eukprot:CAMPEP_0170072510 /NCGR_PEP_ID=MMETSP0019_2-20121128/10130_1 /TAXON_ID=98059 /ORGANISM="Dinobryon sp., Strain UTEXLB2267" /LENGTH=340 /DNA_ID=CAMNT_0010281517 /DNA_START=131 /DNA_END=1153 /DNA_ORIENTATION=-